VTPPTWTEAYESNERELVPDRSGQTWVVGFENPHVYLIVGPPVPAHYNNSTNERWLHPTLDLTTGRNQRLNEWVFEPWSTRDSGTWKRIG